MRRTLLIAVSTLTIATTAFGSLAQARELEPGDDRGRGQDNVQLITDDRGLDSLLELCHGADDTLFDDRGRGGDRVFELRHGADDGQFDDRGADRALEPRHGAADALTGHTHRGRGRD